MREDWTTAPYKDFLDYIQPTNYLVDSTDYYDSYKTPVLTAGKTFILGYTNEEHGIFEDTPVIIFDDFTTASKYVNFKFKAKSSAMKILKPTSTLVDLKFIYYSMQMNQINTDTHKRYWISIYAEHDLLVPPLLEQKAIVAKIEQLFSELDNGIENLKTAQAKLKIYRQAVLKKAFEGEFTREWREKQTHLPTAEELLETIKQEREAYYLQQLEEWKQAVKEWEINGGNSKKPNKPKKQNLISLLTEEEIQKLPSLPDIWLYDYLAYAGELGRGKSKHRPRNDKKLFDGNYPFIQTGEVKAAGSKEIIDYSKTYNDFGLAQSKLWKKGTLCITIAANIAETAFLGIDACFPDSIVGYKPFNKIVNSKYIDYFFKANKQKISAFAPATAQKNINLTTLENLVIPYCSLQEQNQIVQEIESRLSVCDKIEETISNSIAKTEALRQSILKKAFEGNLLNTQELEVIHSCPDYESAEKLLKRIKQERAK